VPRSAGKFGQGREVVIVECARTPIGRGHREKGWFRDVHPNELLGTALRAVVDRAAIDPGVIENSLTGCVQQIGEQQSNIGRNAWLQAGLPIETPSATIDSQCGSAQLAVNWGAALVSSGVHDVVMGSGVEHMGRLPGSIAEETAERYGTPWPPALTERHALQHQGLAAEMIAEHWEIPRADLDQWALRSHQRAARATEEGRFEREIAPVQANGETYGRDQGIRPDASLEAIGSLGPAFKPDGRITAASSSQVSDGAAAVLMTTPTMASELGLTPRARIYDQLSVGSDPVLMLTGPIPATKAILKRNGMTLDDVDLVEINEAFASVTAAWQREVEPDMERVNVNGGAMALGHPVGSTGARLITTLLHELERTDREMGLVTMCCGGGLGTATLIQRV
jgi:acetyl-CoA acetyltransferase family protein